MNSTVTFPPSFPELKLPRADRWEATLDEERRRLQEDIDVLRERESNLREYEARLRAWQAEIDAGRGIPPTSRTSSLVPFHRPTSQAPFVDDAALQTAWEKMHRAREILEAEQTHLRNDRITLKEQQETLKAREDVVAVREANVAAREALLKAAAVPVVVTTATEPPASAVARFTRAPFEMARSVLRGIK